MSLISMEALFKKANLPYEGMIPFKFYDVSGLGLRIKSYNEKSKKPEFKTIKALVYKGQEPIYQVRSADGTVILEGSGGHGIFDPMAKEYRMLQQVGNGFALQGTKTIPITVSKTDKTRPVLDMEVEDNQNYFSNGILSHNTGGNSVKYFSSIRNRVTKVDVIKDGKAEVGIQIKVRNLKNKTSVPWREAIMNLYFDGGFQTDAEYVDFLMEFDIVKQKGAYFYVPGVEKGLQGKDALIQWLDDHPEEYSKWKVQVLEALSGALESDANNKKPEDDEPMPTRGSAEAVSLAEAAASAGLSGDCGDDEEPPDLTGLASE